jgi:hypothetical protein
VKAERLRDAIAATVGRRLSGLLLLVAVFVAVGELARAVLS